MKYFKMGTADAFISSSHIIDGTSGMAGGLMVKAELLAAAERLGTRLPPNTLDQLINELGGPEFVAEVILPEFDGSVKEDYFTVNEIRTGETVVTSRFARVTSLW